MTQSAHLAIRSVMHLRLEQIAVAHGFWRYALVFFCVLLPLRPIFFMHKIIVIYLLIYH